MLSFEEVKSVLIAVQSNPELHQQALKECVDLYSEMFVAEDGTFTGSDVLQNLDMNSPCSQYTVEQYLCEIVQLEIDINSIKYELNTDDDAVIYTEIIKREAYRSYAFNMSNNYYYDDEDDEDDDYISINAQLHDDTPYYQEDYAAEASEYTLILLLFLVGIQLRNNGMTLKQIVLNRRGMIVAVVVVVSSLIGGLINAFILDLPINTALAMASGFGWYSLSGILLTESFGPVIGSAAFFNDLARELIAIMLIPGLIRRSRSTALGLCGATSMDFTLPVLQRTGGLDMVPAAIVHGFILSLLVPILIAFFSA